MSGIYIKGVQMPKDDWESIWIHPSGAVCYGGNFMLIKNAEAFAVPDHGDLIDRDMLLSKVQKWYWEALETVKRANAVIKGEREET